MVIKIYGVPVWFTEAPRLALLVSLKKATGLVEGINVPDDRVVVIISSDWIATSGMERVIVVKVDGLFANPERTPEVLHNLAVAVVRTMADAVGKGYFIECTVSPLIDPDDGRYSFMMIPR